MKNSLYAQYVKEKYGQDTLETEHGFVVYKLDNTVCSIETMFIVPGMRRKSVGRGIIRMLLDKIPKAVKYLACEVDLTAHKAEATYKTIRNYGFEPLSTRGNSVVLVKYI